MSTVDWSRFDEWLTAMQVKRRFGLGCGSAEFEGRNWRDEVRWRAESGARQYLVSDYIDWCKENPK